MSLILGELLDGSRRTSANHIVGFTLGGMHQRVNLYINLLLRLIIGAYTVSGTKFEC